MTDFDKLKQRVEAAGGKVRVERGAYIGVDMVCLYIPGCFGDCETSDFELDNDFIELINGYLDGLDAQARARRLAEFLDNFTGFSSKPERAKIEEKCYKDCAYFIRSEFGIEEAK